MHTPSCQKRIDKITESREKFIAQYPNYCTKCGGSGLIGYSYDPSPAGVSLGSGSMYDCEPCSCVEEGRCPRCIGDLVFIQGVLPNEYDYSICPSCHWPDRDPNLCEGIAEYDDCECHEIGVKGL